MMMFWFLFDRYFHAKQLPIWWMGLSQFPGSLSPLMTSRSYTCRVYQFVFLTHLRLRQWPCSRLCWCPACKEALVSGKWFAHWQCTLCWQSPTAFALWWINPVDRLTCSHCDALRTNILKQLLKSQQDITWDWFPSIPGGVQNLA